jgi:hypothetical protein
VGLRIRQHAYFNIKSDVLDAAAITARLGVDPDDVLVRGARQVDPPRPAVHMWAVRCDERGLRVDEQVAVVLARLRPVEPRLVALAAESDCSFALTIVRDFNDAEGDGEREEFSPPEDRVQKLSGQHQLLGWALDEPDVAFLARVGAFIDVDEYG